MSRKPDFFDVLEKNVNILRNIRLPLPPPRSRPATKATLVVRNVGSFEASFAPTRADLDRLDPRFRLDAAVWQKLRMYDDFGFAVFKLRPGLKRIHPMALKFPRRDPSALFFPTVHVHDGHRVPASAKFDHELYFQSAGDPAIRRHWYTSRAPVRDFLRKSTLPAGLMEMDEPCYAIKIHGRQPNRDVYLVEDENGRMTDPSDAQDG